MTLGGGIAAAPFTGGASLIPTVLGAAGSALGGMAKGAEGDRLQQTAALASADELRRRGMSDYEAAQQSRARLDLDQRESARQAQSDAYMKAIRGALAQNFAPTARPAGVPSISFIGKGIGDTGRANAAELERQATIALLGGEKFAPLPTLERFTPSAAPKASTLEKLAGILGLGLTGASAVAGGLQAPPRVAGRIA